jgi:glycosyltransferase involved in cell wall biosynthesis
MISIIIPTFNRAKFISRAIHSVLNQTYNDWELIIVDDGSKDRTEEVVSEFIKTDSRISYMRIENSGATKARNVGAFHASKDYITFLDSDDEARINWLSTFKEFIDCGEKVICCGYEYFNHEGIKTGVNLPYNMGSLYYNRVGRFTNGGVFLLKKELFVKINGYDENVKAGQHSEMAIRLFDILEEENISIRNIHIPLIKVHVHNDSKIRSDDLALFDGTMYVLQKHHNRFLNNIDVYSNYLGVAALSAVKLKKYFLASRLFLISWLLKPLNLKKLLRYVISKSPMLRKVIWC